MVNFQRLIESKVLLVPEACSAEDYRSFPTDLMIEFPVLLADYIQFQTSLRTLIPCRSRPFPLRVSYNRFLHKVFPFLRFQTIEY